MPNSKLDRRRFIALASAASAPAITGACGKTAQTGRRYAPVDTSAERVIRTVAGLRPYRPSGFVVRSERIAGKTIVHNYGHGGAGVTLSWGTASLAVDEVPAAAGGSAAAGRRR